MVIEEFECKRGNYTIRGEIRRKGNSKLKIAVLCHGFLANSSMVKQYADILAENGYVAFRFDFVGGSLIGKSDGKLNEMSITTELEDLKTVIEYALKQEFTVSDGLLLLGCSQGGLVCALAAASLKDRVSYLILLYPAFCIPDDARTGKMLMFKFDVNNIPNTIKGIIPVLKLGRIYPESVIQMNVYEEIYGYCGNVLIMHGTKDKIVDISYSEKAKEIYEQCGAKCRLEIIENAGHMFKGKYDKTAIKKLLQWINI